MKTNRSCSVERWKLKDNTIAYFSYFFRKWITQLKKVAKDLADILFL